MPKPDWSSAVMGGLAGAGTGLTVGGPLGALAGGVLGAGAGLFGGETKDKVKQVPIQNKDQQALAKLIYQGIAQGKGPYAEMFKGIDKDKFAEMFPGLTGGFNEEQFTKGITEPGIKNFQENILPQLQERYIANNQAGGTGQRRAELRAATDLQSQLNQLRYNAQQNQAANQAQGAQLYGNMQQQAAQNQLNASQLALGNQGFQNIYQQGQSGTGQKLVDATLPQLVQYGANRLMPQQSQRPMIPGVPVNNSATQVG